MGPWRNSSPSPGLFALLKNEQDGLVDFWCPASTNILEYCRGWHTCPDEAKPNTPNLRPRGQLGSREILDHTSHSGHSELCPFPRLPASPKRPAAQILTRSDSQCLGKPPAAAPWEDHGALSDPPMTSGVILSKGDRGGRSDTLVQSALQHLLSKSVPQTSWTVRAPGGPQKVQEGFVGNLRGVQEAGTLAVAFSPSSYLVPEGVTAQARSQHSANHTPAR